MKINPIQQSNIQENTTFKAKFFSKQLKNITTDFFASNKKELLPIISTPLIAYNINKEKVIEESTRSYQPYKKS